MGKRNSEGIGSDNSSYVKKCFLLLLFMCCALFGGICYYGDASLSECIQSITDEGQVTLTGKVISIRQKKEGTTRVVLGQVTVNKNPVNKIPGKIQVILEGNPDSSDVKEKCLINIQPDDILTVRGEVLPLSPPTNPGEFDSRIYYRAQGIRCLMMGEEWRLTSRKPFSIRAIAWWIKERISRVYRSVLSEEDASLLEAMVLGDKTNLSEDQKITFSENGAAHLLAISGLHVSILGGSLFRLLRKRRLGYPVCCLAGASVLIFYGCMTGFGSSAARAVIMYLVYLLGQYLGADYDIISAMSLSGILLLTEYPARLLEGGFQLSFLSVFAIGFVLPLAKELKDKKDTAHHAAGEFRENRDTAYHQAGEFRDNGDKAYHAAGEFRENRDTAYHQAGEFRDNGDKAHQPLEKLKEAFFAGVIISGVTSPLVMRIFSQWTPASVVLNLILLPCMIPLMISAVCGGLSGLFLIKCGEVILLPARVILLFFRSLFGFTSLFPEKAIITGCPRLWQLAMIYLLEITLFFIWLYPDKVRILMVFLAGTAALFYGSAGSVSLLSSMAEPGANINMFDVGQGECILIRTPDRKTLLIDGGSTSRKNVGKYVISPALKYYGVKRLDHLVVTHLDEDHISGLLELFDQGYKIKSVYLPDAGKTDPAWQSFKKIAEEAGARVRPISVGDRLAFSDMAFTCLHPAAGYEPEDRNDSSVVLHMKYKEFDMLFTGDLGAEEERFLTGSNEDQLSEDVKEDMDQLSENLTPDSCDVLKVAHHGSRYSTSEEFLDHYPDIKAALISAGKNNRYGHPHQELLDRLDDRKITYYVTSSTGAIHLRTDGKTFYISEYIKN